MWKFIKHEWKLWLSSPMTWIFLLINTLLIMGGVSSDNISIGGGTGSVYKNSPFVIQTFYGVMSIFTLLMTTAFMNASVNRDFQHGMYQFIFTSPIKKYHYYFGKFIGAATIAMIPMLGVSLGALIGPLMPWAQADRFGPVIWQGHIQGLIGFAIPNVIITGVLLFSLALLFRSSMVSFIGAIAIWISYGISSGFIEDIEKEWLANILDPLGFRPRNIIGKYMTVDEKNLSAVPLQGAFLWNRIMWVGISLLILFTMYTRFSFSIRSKKVRKRAAAKKTEPGETLPAPALTGYTPRSAGKATLGTFWKLTVFEVRTVIKNPVFLIIVLLGLVNLTVNLSSFTGLFGSSQYPVTYDIILSIKGTFHLFVIAVITFYSGALVWKERDARVNEIQDATPVHTGLLFCSKLAAMIFAVFLILCSGILVGMIAQTAHGYTRYEPGVYVSSLLVMDMLSFSYLIVCALFFHYLINNRYIAYFAFIVFVTLNSFLWSALEINSNMVEFGNTPGTIYSDMNGFGPFIPGQIWFNLYWILFCIPLGIVIYSFYTRGTDLAFRNRLQQSGQVLGKNKIALVVSAALFLACGGVVYYNTQVLNTYDSEEQSELNMEDYERTYKIYEHIPQPRFSKINYMINMIPEDRSMTATIEAWAVNKSNQPINAVHFTLPALSDSVIISIKGATPTLRDDRLKYRIYTLATPMQPGDSIGITVNTYQLTRGFENEVSFTSLTQNGTFFNNTDICPVIGYSASGELRDKHDRTKHNLPKRIHMPQLDEQNLDARKNNYISTDADWVEISTTISTSPDQIAVAPGSLIRSWEQDGRSYFTYKLEQSSLNFYSFISARYEVARKQWNGIDLEVYYIKEHAYNVPNMLRSMEQSLEYYTKHFGPYYHKQCRIIEFPRYSSFAQAFPGTMPYSEELGFITDLRGVTRNDIDVVFYVVAHEMGHQYWAHQVCGAFMQGSEMMSEGFAQYSALMVMEKEYGRDKMNKFLKYEMNDYLSGRSREPEAERPLMKTQHQGYIHYNKASVVMYYLKEMIGENNVNTALRSLVDSFAYRQPPYPVSTAAVSRFRAVTPDSLQYLIDDMFENITLFSNRVTDATWKKAGNEYVVTLKTESEKFRADSLGTESPRPVGDYIDIGVFAAPADKGIGKPLVMQRVKITGKNNSFTFRTSEKPYQAGIDPYNYLVDRQPSDNLRKVSETD
jgi:ABC-2 type transport system permease protein